MRWTRSFVSAVMIAGAVASSATAAQAVPPPAPGNGIHAQLAGKAINLKTNGWDGAQTCVVHTRALVQCYATAAEADKALGYSRETDPLVMSATARGLTAAAALPACANGWVCLWEADQGRGRRLIFRDDIYQDLDGYAFADKVSSWRNNQPTSDWAFLKDDDPGGPDNAIPASLSGKSYSSNVGTTWNDRADLIQG